MTKTERGTLRAETNTKETQGETEKEKEKGGEDRGKK